VRIPVRTDTTGVRTEIDRLRQQLGSRSNSINLPVGLRAADVASITAATNRLNDAQERVRTTQAELAALRKKEGVSEDDLAEASRKVTRAQRDQELAAIRLAAAEETVAAAQQRAPPAGGETGCGCDGGSSRHE
jgi:chromosome segregation ATPase